MDKLTKYFIIEACLISIVAASVLIAAFKVMSPPDYLPPSEPPAFIKTNGQAEYETTPLINTEPN